MLAARHSGRTASVTPDDQVPRIACTPIDLDQFLRGQHGGLRIGLAVLGDDLDLAAQPRRRPHSRSRPRRGSSSACRFRRGCRTPVIGLSAPMRIGPLSCASDRLDVALSARPAPRAVTKSRRFICMIVLPLLRLMR